MTVASRRAWLEARIPVLDAKIAECENAQSYGIAGRTVSKVQYESLQRQVAAYRVELNRLIRGSYSTNPEFPSAS